MNAKIALTKIIVLVTCLAAVEAQAVVGSAVVRALRGLATYSEGTNAPAPLRSGKVLKPGTKIKTEPNSQVDIFLDQNGPVVRVTENTTLGLDKLDFSETGADTVIDTQLNLMAGRILGSVKKMAAASKYEVRTLVGTVGIRGSDYDISANGQVRMTSGSAVMTSSGALKVINAGNTLEPASPPGTRLPPKQEKRAKKTLEESIIEQMPPPAEWISPFPRPLPRRAF